MIRHLSVRRAATRDALTASKWYAAQGVGLDRRFLQDVVQAFSRIQTAPESFAFVANDVRVCILSGFPYGVYFLATDAEIIALAVLHLSRHPRLWKRRRKTER